MIQKPKSAKPTLWKAALCLPIVALLTFVYSCHSSETTSPDIVSKERVQYQLSEIVVVGYTAKENTESLQKQREKVSGKENSQKSIPITKDIALMPEENQPAPVEGYDNFYRVIQKTIKYPAPARAKFREGKVWIRFTIKADGTLTDLETVNSVQQDIDQEAIRVVQATNMQWKPAMEDGKAVDIKLLFPISFKINM